MTRSTYPRRRFLIHTGVLGLGTTLGLGACGSDDPEAPAVIVPDSERPKLTDGIQIGDVGDGRAVIWARADRAARLRVEYDTTDRFANPRQVLGPSVTAASDYTGRIELTGLPAGESIFLRVAYDNVDNPRATGVVVPGQFRTMPRADANRPVRFVWGGDVAGQGWGINTEFGGMRIFEAMRRRSPDFFLHSGDTIYADGPIQAEVSAEGGRVWKNIVTPQVAKVAETLDEYRGRYRYNLLDDNVRRFSAEVPQIWQWDDHEVTNNWSPSKDLSADTRYTEKNIATLVARATQAFREYAPIRLADGAQPQTIHRKIGYGPLLDVFVLDMRSYRGPNTANLQTTEGAETAFLGNAQIDWLVNALKQSQATWKVIAADMPIGLWVADGKDASGNTRWEAVANGDNGVALGRELEIARLLRDIKGVPNVVWLTADVHYCAAHYYDPAQARFTDFAPFWEFVAGPLNAGTFGPNTLDATFGPQLVFQKAPPAGQSNLSPFSGYQFFGEVNIDPRTRELTVDLRDLDGVSQFSRTLGAV
ncbi:alkaline phosphatase D [Cupriavidus gilardii J11]|uniref:Alkaline phosphatase D n=1 Tax=Cupriavidus gilardii J11 TaxID=936133 RepID=A0A562BVP8_9BURK|nr:alkaline phosphatase D family protein [Cupriavidus gilardii]TWG88870.1 alkaline phosphatase D [Cupriavidus gilardii J11]